MLLTLTSIHMSSSSAQPESTNDLPVCPCDLPLDTRFQIAGRNQWFTMLADGNVRVGGKAGAVGQIIDQLPPNAIVPQAELPEVAVGEKHQRRERKGNRMRERGPGRPEWAVRLLQAETLDKARRAAAGLPVYGPDKNPLDREHRNISWHEVPSNSFCLLTKELPGAQVYAKVSDDVLFPVCTLEEWTNGKRPHLILNSRLYKTTSDLGMNDDCMVTVLNAPTPAQVHEQVQDVVEKTRNAGKPIDKGSDQRLQGMIDRAETFGSAA